VRDLHGWITRQIDTADQHARDGRPVLDDEGRYLHTEHLPAPQQAAVLRRCTADRKILELHGGRCHSCPAKDENGYLDEWTEFDYGDFCPVVQLLAEGYGLTPEISATLDWPEPERPEPRVTDLNAIMRLLSAQPTSSVPVALRGPNWRGP
jgi:hypothetical protein